MKECVFIYLRVLRELEQMIANIPSNQTSAKFDTVSHSIFLQKLAAYSLDRYTLAGYKTGWKARPREWW